MKISFLVLLLTAVVQSGVGSQSDSFEINTASVSSIEVVSNSIEDLVKKRPPKKCNKTTAPHGSKPNTLSLERLTSNKLKELHKVLANTQAVSHVVKQEPDDLQMAKRILVEAIISGNVKEINLSDLSKERKATSKKPTTRTTLKRTSTKTPPPTTKTTTRRRQNSSESWEYEVDEPTRTRTTRRRRPPTTTRRTTTRRVAARPDTDDYFGDDPSVWRTTRPDFDEYEELPRRRTTRRRTTVDDYDYWLEPEYRAPTRRRTTRRPYDFEDRDLVTRRRPTRRRTTRRYYDYGSYEYERTTRRPTRRRTTRRYYDYGSFENYTRARRPTRRRTTRRFYDYDSFEPRRTTRRRTTPSYYNYGSFEPVLSTRRTTRRRTTKLPYDYYDEWLGDALPRTTTRRRNSTTRSPSDPFENYDLESWETPRRTSRRKSTKVRKTSTKKCKSCPTCPFARHPLDNVKYNVEVGTSDRKKVVIKPSVMIYSSAESKSQDFYEESNDVLANQYKNYMLQIKVPKAKRKKSRKSKSRVKQQYYDDWLDSYERRHRSKRRKSKATRRRGSEEERHFFHDDNARRRYRSLLWPSGEAHSAADSGAGSSAERLSATIAKDEGVADLLRHAIKDLKVSDVKLTPA